MAVQITSIGAKISYAVETVAGTRPTTGYIHIPNLKEFPEVDAQPNSADSTTFDNTTYTSYTPLLKDLGGALEIVGGMNPDLFEVWNTMYESYATASEEGKTTWICVDIPGLTQAGFIPSAISSIGIPGLTTNSLVDKSLYFTPIGEPIWDTKPTYAEE